MKEKNVFKAAGYIAAFLIVTGLLVLNCGFIRSKAATDIRVGLKALYSGKSIITIYNTAIKMGYCIKDSYRADIILKSAGGFSFEPDRTGYYTNGDSYDSYSKAASALKALGKKGLICYAGRTKWMVYLKEMESDPAFTKVNSSHVIKISFGKKTLLIDGSVSSAYPQFAPSGNDTRLSLGSRSYRGRIEIGRYGSDAITAVNIVNIESYLLSVVSCEISSTWHSEVQKAQAIAARSYCLAYTGFKADSDIKKGYEIVDTDESQVYAGFEKETDSSRYAVKTTLKKVLKSDGKVLPAYYFSTSGGATEFSSDIWGGNNSSFIGVFDEYETNPEVAPWTIKTTYADLESKLKNKGYKVSNITDIYPEILSDSGRVSSVKIKHDGGTLSVKGSIIKSLYSMRSTKYRIVTSNSDNFDIYVKSRDDSEEVYSGDISIISGTGQVNSVKQGTDQLVVISADNMTNFPISRPGADEIWFLGMGSGHGIGMSQSGAYGMAMKGYKYDEILKYYYNNIEIASY